MGETRFAVAEEVFTKATSWTPSWTSRWLALFGMWRKLFMKREC